MSAVDEGVLLGEAARAIGRSGEMAVRLSIGASRWQLAVQLLTESSLLALAGGVAGIAVAQWTLDLIASVLPAFATAGFDWSVDRAALVFVAFATPMSFHFFNVGQALGPAHVYTSDIVVFLALAAWLAAYLLRRDRQRSPTWPSTPAIRSS